FLGAAVAALVRPDRWLKETSAEGGGDADQRAKLEMAAFFLVGIYTGFIQAGAGVLMLLTLSLIGGRDLMSANGIKLWVNGLLQIVTLVGFALAGQVDWLAGGVVGLGAVAGAVAGSHMAFAKGSRLIFAFVILVMVATGVRLLIG
ncbi:MAG: sulfite exporter TauE/SafE family protein, partial [Phycisphaeraceae bacterium]|nr:sulfite exporter TauE/SafE family protein [Phycisphaeraceae bacterium]